jgi:hypothetical protein
LCGFDVDVDACLCVYVCFAWWWWWWWEREEDEKAVEDCPYPPKVEKRIHGMGRGEEGDGIADEKR